MFLQTPVKNEKLLVSSGLDGISRPACGAEGETKHTNSRTKTEGRMCTRRRERRPYCEFSMGSEHEEGPPLKFVSLSMVPQMIDNHPDMRNINNLFFFSPNRADI